MQADYIEPNKEEKQEKLEEDYETPFSRPLDMPNNVPKDYPTKDTDMDETEWYQNGGAVASSTEFPKRVKRDKPPAGYVEQQASVTSLELTSPVLDWGGEFPRKYTCDGANVSPPLEILGVPSSASSLVLILDDPDAAKEPRGNGQTYDHWVVYNIFAVNQNIAENHLPLGGRLGRNGSGGSKYVGPCPPTFRHRYAFRLFALDSKLLLNDLPTRAQVEASMKGHVLERAELIAYYERS